MGSKLNHALCFTKTVKEVSFRLPVGVALLDLANGPGGFAGWPDPAPEQLKLAGRTGATAAAGGARRTARQQAARRAMSRGASVETSLDGDSSSSSSLSSSPGAGPGESDPEITEEDLVIRGNRKGG